jgi:hypothetical protein
MNNLINELIVACSQVLRKIDQLLIYSSEFTASRLVSMKNVSECLPPVNDPPSIHFVGVDSSRDFFSFRVCK